MDKTELNRKLDKMFYPASVAVCRGLRGAGEVGQSHHDPRYWDGNTRGKSFPVNPKMDKVLGLKSYPSLTAIPEDVDCAGPWSYRRSISLRP